MSKTDELLNLALKVQSLRGKFTDVNDKINTCSDRIATLDAEMKTWGFFTPQRKELSQQVTTLKNELAELKKEEALLQSYLLQIHRCSTRQ